MTQAAIPELPRRERRRLEVRGRILEAAVSLFEARGFGATKVATICDRADVAHKTFFNHFPSKRHLLREIARYALEELLTDIEQAAGRPATTRARLLHFFERVADNAAAAGPMHREFLTEIIHVAHEAGTEPEQARKLQDAFGAIVREGRAAGDVRRDHDEHSQTELVLGAFYALMFNWAHLDGYPLRQRALAAARLLGDALSGPAPAADGEQA